MGIPIKKYLEAYNENPLLFVWAKFAGQILESINTCCTRIDDTLHQQVVYNVSENIRQSIPPALMPKRQTFMIDTQEV